MQRVFSYVVVLLMLIGSVSCQKEETKPLTSSNADGSMIITVKAERLGSLEPYTVHIILTHNNEDLEVTTEVYADTIDESNVKFEWKSDKQCIVHLTHRDGIVNSVPVGVNY
jgi:hypothetical protein